MFLSVWTTGQRDTIAIRHNLSIPEYQASRGLRYLGSGYQPQRGCLGTHWRCDVRSLS